MVLKKRECMSLSCHVRGFFFAEKVLIGRCVIHMHHVRGKSVIVKKNAFFPLVWCLSFILFFWRERISIIMWVGESLVL